MNALHRKPEVEKHLKHLHMFLNLLVSFGESILSEFLDVHETVSEMTYALAQIFSLLFSEGFGGTEDSTEDTLCSGPHDVSGTGMGEGEGRNDVSDQIEDENQLLGTSNKQEGEDVSDKVPSEKDRGIEMDEDFTGDTFSVSEHSGNSDDDAAAADEEDMNVESKMEKNVDGTEVVDEKLWDKEEDGSPNSPIEKYESGPTVKEKDTSGRELRAKDDNALTAEEPAEMDNDGPDTLNEEEDNSNIDEDASDMKLDKNEAYQDPTELQLNEEKEKLEDVNMDEPQVSDILEDTEPGPTGSDEELGNEDEKSDLTEHVDGENDMQVDENTEKDAEDSNTDLETNKAISESDKMQASEYPVEGSDSLDPISYPDRADSSKELEIHWSNSSNMNNGLAPSGHLSIDEADISMPGPGSDSRLTSDHQPKPQTSEGESSAYQRSQTNPYRSVGNALEEWKERVKVSDDPQEHQSQAVEDENAEEYRYVLEMEKSSSQALGPAGLDQSENSVEGNKSIADEENIRKRDDSEDKMLRENPETRPPFQTSMFRPEPKEESQDANDAPVEEIQRNVVDGRPEDIISFRTSYMNEVLPTLESGKHMSSSFDIKEIPDDMKQKNISDWRRYEVSTTRLSQELAEQMRLILEPTLASKLQGDYRSGKRINMKKVIPYIASHYRKDKIWLRRTRPNKRDYQVVVAVDDSRSMSESHCGDVAVEALVTVCRAMSQLEVGQFAVASFGEKGNIKLLHDFDQPFTGEAGVKMISQLSFKQDNTIADEPVVELLNYLNVVLDTAVAKARTPSGQNPLHQLVLIIADGRFHEKENLKRCVRDALSRKRMIAFILVDSPQESIMDLMEASFQGKTLSFNKYLNSFPFPYYIVLKHIEALPRTLADLLRQWFELMWSMKE